MCKRLKDFHNGSMLAEGLATIIKMEIDKELTRSDKIYDRATNRLGDGAQDFIDKALMDMAIVKDDR